MGIISGDGPITNRNLIHNQSGANRSELVLAEVLVRQQYYSP